MEQPKSSMKKKSSMKRTSGKKSSSKDLSGGGGKGSNDSFTNTTTNRSSMMSNSMSFSNLNVGYKGGGSDDSLSDNRSQTGSMMSSRTGSGNSSFYPKFARKENRRLSCIKIVMVLVLLAATVFVSLSVFWTTSNNEQEQFEAQFADQAIRVIQEFSLMLSQSIGAVDNFAVTITSHVRSMNLAWPYAFVPEFDIRAASTSSLAKAAYLTLTVAVPSEILKDYESYSVNQSFWVDQALARQYGDPVPSTPESMMMHHRSRQLQDMMMEMENMNTEEMNADSSNMTHGVDNDMDMMMPEGGEEDGNGMDMPNMDDMGGDGDMHHGMPGDMGADDSTMGGEDMNQGDMTGEMDHGNMDHEDMDHGDMGHGDMSNGDYRHNTTGMEHTLDYPDIFPHVFHYNQDDMERTAVGENMDTMPIFQCHPVAPDIVNFDLSSHPIFGSELRVSLESEQIVIGKLIMDKHASPIEQFIYQDDDVEEEEEEMMDHSNHNEMNHDDMDHGDDPQGHHRALDQHRNIDHNHETDHHEDDMLHHMHDVAASNVVENKDKGPMSQVAYPVYEGFGDDRRLTGFLTIYVFWADFIAYNLPSAVKNVVMVLTNGCDQVVSYQINSGQYPIYLGEGDHHDTDYSYLEEVMSINAMIRDDTEMGWLQSEIALNQEYCPFEIRVYPSSEMNDSYTSTRPLYYTLLIAKNTVPVPFLTTWHIFFDKCTL